MPNAVVRARIDERVKNQAASVLKSMGLTVSDAFRLLLVRVANEKTLPFEIRTPNKQTIAAMQAARKGQLSSARSTHELLKRLNEND